MRTYLNKDAAVGDSQHVELLTRVSWLSLRQIVASMGPGTYGTKLILSQPLKTKMTNRVLQQTKTRINVRSSRAMAHDNTEVGQWPTK